MRLALLFGVFLHCAISATAEEPWSRADRQEFERLAQEILKDADARWHTRARDLVRAFRSDRWSAVSDVGSEDAGPEVHGVAFFRGDAPDKNDKRIARAPTVASVHVTRTGRDIVLVLCAYESIEWRVKTAKNVRLKKVLVLSRKPQFVRGVPASKITMVRTRFVLQRADRRFSGLRAVVAARVGALPILTYFGGTNPGGKTTEVGDGSRDWRCQMLLSEMRRLHRRATKDFREQRLTRIRRHVFPTLVVSERRVRMFAEYTPTGPIADSSHEAPAGAIATTVDPQTGRRYTLFQRHLQERDAAGRVLASIKLPVGFAARGLAVAVTFDGRRRRVVVAGVTGAVAAFELSRRKWIPLGSPEETDITRIRLGSRGLVIAMCYDAARDCFWSVHYFGRSLKIASTTPYGFRNKSPASFRVPNQIQPGPRTGLVCAVAGDNLAILTPASAGSRRRMLVKGFLVNPLTGKIVETFHLTPVPRVPAPSQSEWPSLWSQLGSHDPYSAMRRIVRGDKHLVAYLRERWEAQPMPDPRIVKAAFLDLSSNHAHVRSEAFAVLASGAPRLRDRIEIELSRQANPEARVLLRRLLVRIDSKPDVRARLARLLSGMTVPGAAAFRASLW